MKKLVALSTQYCILFSVSSALLLAGTTGKISGKITDEKTAEPIVGVSVVLAGTTIGTASDVEGMYVISNILPGSYTINISGVGFRRKVIQSVQVNTDFTTKIDVALSSEAVDLDAVVVVAERPLVRADLTSTHTSVDALQIRSLPVESVAAILKTQAGVIEDADGDLHFRGGRVEEVSYTVNGVSVNNPFTNRNSLSIATNAIQELSVVQGTFNAEYGNALSGVVETGLKEGGEHYAGQISVYTGDRVSNHDNVFLNVKSIDPFSHVVTEGTFGGPLPGTNGALSFFLSARSDNSKGWLYGVREHTVSDKPDFTNDTNWVIPMSGDGSLTPLNKSSSFTATNRLSYRLSPTRKISYDFVFNQARYRQYSHAYKYNPDGTYNNYENDLLHTLEYSDWLDKSTSFKVRGSYSRNIYEQYRYKDLDSLHYEPTENLTTRSGAPFEYGGTRNGQFFQTAETYTVKFDAISQITSRQEIKGGFEVRLPQMYQFSATVLRSIAGNINHPVYPSPEDSRYNAYARFPRQYSAYLQDKMEYESIIMNVGLRYDYFIANAKYPTNIFYPKGGKKKAPAKQTLSPRIGVSYPITDRGIIHFSYGHFYQMPQLRRLFENPDFKFSPDITATTFGNADLNPEKTITYEFGLQQQLTDNLAFTVTGFYKDVRDLFATQTIRISGDTTFNMYVNKDYGNIKGITFSLTKRRTSADMVSFSVDYTFQVAEGNDVSADAFFIDQSSGRESEKVVVYLGWDQPHTLNGTLSVGKYQNWNVSLIGRVGSGLPYTSTVTNSQIIPRQNSSRRPVQSTVDMLAQKDFSVGDLTFVIFLKVFNLLDALNEVSVYTDTGRATYTLQSKYGDGPGIDARLARTTGLHGTNDYYNNPSNYSPPREVRVGITVGF